MDNTTLIVLFLAFVASTLVSNTILIWFAYKGFANVTMKVTETVREIETSGETQEWLNALLSASEQAVKVTEMTKEKVAEFEPAVQDLHARYGFFLAQVDTRVERITSDLSDNAKRVRNAVAKPAEKFAEVATGVTNVLSFLTPDAE